MGLKCPRDDCEFSTRRYPRSSGLLAIQDHLKEAHHEQWKAYLKLKEKERKERSFFDRLINGSNVSFSDVAQPTE